MDVGPRGAGNHAENCIGAQMDTSLRCNRITPPDAAIAFAMQHPADGQDKSSHQPKCHMGTREIQH